jgi:hypothetical protein
MNGYTLSYNPGISEKNLIEAPQQKLFIALTH